MTQNDIRKGVAALDAEMKDMEYTLANLRFFADYGVNVTQEPGYIIRFTQNGQHSDCDIPKGHNRVPPTKLAGFLNYIKAEYQNKINDDILKYKDLREKRGLLNLQGDFI